MTPEDKERLEKSVNIILPAGDKIDLELTAKGAYKWAISLRRPEGKSDEDWVYQLGMVNAELIKRFPVNTTVQNNL